MEPSTRISLSERMPYNVLLQFRLSLYHIYEANIAAQSIRIYKLDLLVRTLEATELSQQETQELKTTEVRKLSLLLSLVVYGGIDES